MQLPLHFTAKHMELSSALKEMCAHKFEAIEKRGPISKAHITFSVEHGEHIAEATIHAHGTLFHATAQTDDMYKSLDLLVEKLLAQITRHKEKLINDHHSS